MIALPAAACTHQSVNLRFRSDIDTSCRFVEQQDFRILMEHTRNRDFLLIAAREFSDRLLWRRSFDLQTSHPVGDCESTTLEIQPTQSRVRCHPTVGHVVRDRTGLREALGLSVFGDEAKTIRDAMPW